MKKTLKLIVAFFAMIVASTVVGQELPKGEYAVEVHRYTLGSASSGINITWRNSWIQAEFSSKGDVISITYLITNKGLFIWTLENEEQWKNTFSKDSLVAFKKLVREIYNEWGFIDDPDDNNLTFQIKPYKLVAMSGSSELNGFHGVYYADKVLIFNRDNIWMTINIANFLGDVPPIGSNVIIGQIQSKDYFFPVTALSSGEFEISPLIRALIKIAKKR